MRLVRNFHCLVTGRNKMYNSSLLVKVVSYDRILFHLVVHQGGNTLSQ